VASQLYRDEAVEEIYVLLILKKDKDFVYENLPQIEKLFRIMIQLINYTKGIIRKFYRLNFLTIFI